MPTLQTRLILWAALLFSTFIYLGVALTAAPPPSGPLSPMTPVVFVAVAVATAAISIFLPTKFEKEGLLRLKLATEAAPSFGDYPGGTLLFSDSTAARRASGSVVMAPFIIRLALREAVATYGLVLAFMGYPLMWYIGFFVATWALMVVAVPRANADDALLEAAYGAKLR